jgi:hypothetical protein
MTGGDEVAPHEGFDPRWRSRTGTMETPGRMPAIFRAFPSAGERLDRAKARVFVRNPFWHAVCVG